MNNTIRKITTLSGYKYLHDYLTEGKITNDIFQYKDKIFIYHDIICRYKLHNMRIWKSNSILDIWYDNLSGYNFVAGLDYEIKSDHVKIHYLNINDEENHDNKSRCIDKKLLCDYLEYEDAKLLTESLIEYAENVARENNLQRIVIDVHQSQRLYNKYYKPCGFVVTDRICSDNPFWIEVEKEVARRERI